MGSQIELAAEYIKKSNHGVALTGAGTSTSSGIPDFRSVESGLWKRYNPLEVATLTSFRYSPTGFYQWLRELAGQIYHANPNFAHLALTELQRMGYIHSIVTQNIDGLHQKAGSKNVIEVHGTFHSFTCIKCFSKFNGTSPGSLPEEIIEKYLSENQIPRCPKCTGILKPDMILFEEQLPVKTWILAQNVCREADVMIVIGSSLEVMPVAGLPIRALDNGAPLIVINQTHTYLDTRADLVIRENVADILPEIVKVLKNG